MKRNFEVENNIVKDYLDGINNKELCQKYSKSRGYIQKVLIKNDITLRKGCDVSKKYKINENYFDVINSSNKAYILGFIFSDGNIFNNTVKINLIKSDSEILYDIGNKIFLDGNIQIHEIKGETKVWKNGKKYFSKPQTALILTRKNIVTSLKKNGLTPKKTFTIRFPDIDTIFYKDFIRGYFDGDGCFYISKKYKNNNRINITSNTLFINKLSKIIENILNIDCKIKESNIKNIDRLNIYGNIKVKKFLDWIYDDAQLKLKRKYNKYLNEYS